jgi:hypothetical protein
VDAPEGERGGSGGVGDGVVRDTGERRDLSRCMGDSVVAGEGVYIGGGTNDAFARGKSGAPRGSPTSMAACRSLA